MVNVWEPDFPLSSFHCRSPRKMNLSRLDPSCCIGFYCRTRDDFYKFMQSVQQVSKQIWFLFPFSWNVSSYLKTCRKDFWSLSLKFTRKHCAVSWLYCKNVSIGRKPKSTFFDNRRRFVLNLSLVCTFTLFRKSPFVRNSSITRGKRTYLISYHNSGHFKTSCAFSVATWSSC